MPSPTSIAARPPTPEYSKKSRLAEASNNREKYPFTVNHKKDNFTQCQKTNPHVHACHFHDHHFIGPLWKGGLLDALGVATAFGQF